MGSPVFIPERNGGRIYQVGRVGYDTGTQDAGGVYTGILRSSKISPLGDTGYCKFRRVVLLVRHTSSFTIDVTIYVDGVQTKVYDQTDMNYGTQLDQVITFSETAPEDPPAETLLQCDISANGTHIEVEVSADSDDVSGQFMLEVVEVHYVPIRYARRGDAEYE